MANDENDLARDQAPRLVTTADNRGFLYLPLVGSVAVVWLLLLSTGPAMVVLVVLLEVGIWLGWWLRYGRFWHPVKELRWGHAESRLGRPNWNDEHVSYRRAWERAGGDPGEDAHAPPATPRSRTHPG